MRARRFVVVWIILASIMTALAAFALFTSPAAAQTTSDEAALHAMVAAWEQAIRQQDEAAYRALVDLSDPIFAREQAFWIEDWLTGVPPDRLQMTLRDIAVEDGGATGTLEVRWAMQPHTSPRVAAFPARFVQDASSPWRYAGVAWTTTETDHFRVHALPDQAQTVEQLVPALPGVYDFVTGSLAYTPNQPVELQLFDNQDALGFTVGLSLPPMRGWNEPGEALKLLVPENGMVENAVLAHELVHYLTFEMAGTAHGQAPWWLEEGVAEYVGSEYWDEAAQQRMLSFVQRLLTRGELVPWDEISDFDTAPYRLWAYVYPQGYAFARYVTETYGVSARNDWLRLMATDLDLAAATQRVFGEPFAKLDEGFRVWLGQAGQAS